MSAITSDYPHGFVCCYCISRKSLQLPFLYIIHAKPKNLVFFSVGFQSSLSCQRKAERLYVSNALDCKNKTTLLTVTWIKWGFSFLTIMAFSSKWLWCQVSGFKMLEGKVSLWVSWSLPHSHKTAAATRHDVHIQGRKRSKITSSPPSSPLPRGGREPFPAEFPLNLLSQNCVILSSVAARSCDVSI